MGLGRIDSVRLEREARQRTYVCVRNTEKRANEGQQTYHPPPHKQHATQNQQMPKERKGQDMRAGRDARTRTTRTRTYLPRCLGESSCVGERLRSCRLLRPQPPVPSNTTPHRTTPHHMNVIAGKDKTEATAKTSTRGGGGGARAVEQMMDENDSCALERAQHTEQ